MVVIMPLNTIMYYIMCMDYIGHGVYVYYVCTHCSKELMHV